MMTENQNNKNSFKKLKRSILLKMAAVVLVSFAVGVCFLFLFVDGIFQAPFANFIMDTLAN
jgi:hypothetical protein